MALPLIQNATGTVLNQYTLEHADSTTEVVKLTFNPSADYVAGTMFNATDMNPVINAINDNTEFRESVSYGTALPGSANEGDIFFLYEE